MIAVLSMKLSGREEPVHYLVRLPSETPAANADGSVTVEFELLAELEAAQNAPTPS